MEQLGKGRALAIADSDIAKLADEIGCHPADLEAIAQVESNGFGWFPDGRMKILFEKHWFYKYLDDPKVRANAVKSGLARKKWMAPKDGGYKDQATATDRYRLLQKAIKINEEGAYRSTSMGSFQIMGFNYALCGFVSAKHMFVQFCDSEARQLEAFAKFLKGKGLHPALKARNFNRIEEAYNGGGLNGAYAKKMRQEADKLRAGKWRGYKPGSMNPVPPKPAPVEPSSTPPLDHVPVEKEQTPMARMVKKYGLATLILSIIASVSRRLRGK